MITSWRSRQVGTTNSTESGSHLTLALLETVETRTRNAGGPKKLTPYQRRLAKLKSQRERRNTGEPTTSQPGADSNSEDESDEYDEEYGTNECGLEDVFSDAKQGEPEAEDEEGQGDSIGDSSASFYRTNDLDSNLTDFVVQDTADDLLGAPDDAEMPLEFTSASHDANPDQFRIYCQFLIYSVLFPGMVAKDERVENAIRRLEASTAGFGDSVVRSGAWRPEFDRALRARPILETRDCYPVEHCDACNRNNQNCGHKVQFRGRRYNKDTLDDLSSDEDEETDDSLGNKLGGEDQEFALGSMCFTRTKQAHALYHWKKELKGCVKAELERRGYIDEDGEVLNEEVEGMDEKGKLGVDRGGE